MVARTLPLSFPAGTVNSVRSLCRFSVTNKHRAVSFPGTTAHAAPLVSFWLFSRAERIPLYCSTRCRANHLTRFEQPRRLHNRIDSVVGAAEVNPESLTAYCLSIAKLHMVSLALDCYSKVSSPPASLVCAPAVRPPLERHAQASASTTLVLHARNGAVHTLSVEP